MKNSFSVTVAFALAVLSGMSVDAKNCVDLMQDPSKYVVFLNHGHTPTNLQISERINGQISNVGSNLSVSGEILSAMLVSGNSTLLFEGQSVARAKERFVEELLNIWEYKHLHSSEALRYLDIYAVVKIREAGEDRAAVEKILGDEFLTLNRIDNPANGLFVDRRSGFEAKSNVNVSLNSSGELDVVDLGELPPGIYKLELRVLNDGSAAYRTLFLELERSDSGKK